MILLPKVDPTVDRRNLLVLVHDMAENAPTQLISRSQPL
jgi:hypothetical protein